MATASALAFVVLGLGVLATFGLFAAVSAGEGERRAVRVALALGAATGLPLVAAVLLPHPVRLGVLGVVAAALAVAVVLWFVPAGSSRPSLGRPARRVDERDVMFARARLEPGTPEYETYYRMHPSRRAVDDRTRSFTGLLSPDAWFAEPVAFAAAAASFELTEKTLRHAIDGPVAETRAERPAAEWTAIVKELVLYHGARAVGVTALRPYHVYSHVGRGTGRWGEPIELDHDQAIAFTVEMDHAAIQPAPAAPVIRESARQYVEAAKIAIQVATVIRSFGYPARAHIDGNYRVIAPLVARDAGLGEIGRMGILMTPRLGPRVRLGVVTTKLPLVADPPGDDPTVIDFCTICKKCAESCPAGSIPTGDPTPIDDASRWFVNAVTCFRYWRVIGTDCCRCMVVCPYSHPDDPTHGLARWAVRRSALARRALLRLDDLFYGRRRPLPRRKKTSENRIVAT